jgi:hypothetical protein
MLGGVFQVSLKGCNYLSDPPDTATEDRKLISLAYQNNITELKRGWEEAFEADLYI